MRKLTLPAVAAGVLLASSAAAQTCPQTFTGALGATSPTIPRRLFRNGVPSTCQALKANPGTSAGGPFAYQTFPFTVPGVPRCVLVTTNGTGCGGEYIFGAVYLGSFEPANVAKNWLADSGSSGVPPSWAIAFSFVSDPDASYVYMASVTTAAGAACPSFSVSVNDCQPGMVVFPASADYGASTVAVAASRTLTVYNNGTGNLNVTGVTLGGPDVGDFGYSGLPALPATIPASGTLAFAVTFTPAASGARAGTLTVTSDDAIHHTQDVALFGAGTWLQAAPNPLSFGPVNVGESSAATVTFTNTSASESRVVSTLTLAGANAADFSLSPAPALPQTLAPGVALTIPVAFAPAATGSRSATLEIASDDPDAPVFLVGLSGAGATVTPGVTLTTLDFGNQNVKATSPAKTIDIKNYGLASMVVQAASVEGPDAAMFEMKLPSPLPISIASGATASVSVTFTPASKGAKSATASFTVGEVPAALTVSLAGNGTESGCGCGGGPADGAALLGAALLGRHLLRRRR